MLEIIVPGYEVYDEAKGEFAYVGGCTLQLEHSLISVSKWEAKWEKPFLGREAKTAEQALDYVRCMTIGKLPSAQVYEGITKEQFEQINRYIDAKMTATWFSDKENRKFSREIVTSEIIYYWMVALNIPFECQKWHLNRLLTLVRVCNIKQTPPKKSRKGTRSMAAARNALNNARRASTGSNG